MNKHVDLLHGGIVSTLVRLSLPLMGTSLLQMAYNLTDMLWIGRLGAGAVASVGTAGMFLWLGNGLNTLARVGGQVQVGQSMGAGDRPMATRYAQAALQLSAAIGVALGLVLALGAGPLVAFFRLSDAAVVADARLYLRVVGSCTVLACLVNTLTALITATGNSRTPFLATTAGLVLNMALDPVLIFGLVGAPRLGVLGAGIATVLAQALVAVLLCVYAAHDAHLLAGVRPFTRPRAACVREILRLSAPVTVQQIVFPLIAMVLARMVAAFGDGAVGAQKVGTQIESISWMAADGFAVALNSFIAQNRGAGDLRRANRGYGAAMGLACVWGTLTSLLLILAAGPIFRLFITEEAVLPIGVHYLVAQGWSQLFMCVEIVTVGAFNGYGVTVLPAAVDIALTAARLPLAAALSAGGMGLDGIWWAISVSSIAKGIVVTGAFLGMLARQRRAQAAHGEG